MTPKRCLGFLLLLAILHATSTLAADSPTERHAGFARLSVANPLGGAAIQTFLWYPTTAASSIVKMGPFEIDVAVNGEPENGAHPLVVISHGTGGSNLDQRDTAVYLAGRGFVVATLTHPGDNFQDTSGYGKEAQLFGRPRHIKAVIDAALADARFGKIVDAARIGVAGMSAGGYTALVLSGGKPDFSRFAAYCREHPEDPWVCKRDLEITTPPALSDWALVQEARIKAAVLMAPALGFAFDRESLTAVKLPIRMYRAEADEVVRYPNNVEYLKEILPRAPEYIVLPGAGHYVFLAPCPPVLAQQAREICVDAPGVDRAALHARLNAEIEDFFRRTLR
ncbi:MAG TPA: dienelactone hydrolase family protein [Candidatus Binatia bacterium]|nr:dienelactone hydrolase family protein [Candidatus Binatia bacterium]